MKEAENKKNDDIMFFEVDEDENTQADKYLTFPIGNESYAVSIGDVVEIIELQKIVSMPDVPEYIKGVINLRGKVIPVMNLRLRFKLEERSYDNRTCIVIIDIKGKALGLIVDTVTEVITIPQDQIENAPEFHNNGSKYYIKGLGKYNNNVKIIIDLDRIMFEKEQEILNAVIS